MAASRPVEWRHFDVILLKSTAAILAAVMFVGDRTTASTSLAGAAAVGVRDYLMQRPTGLSASIGHIQIGYQLLPYSLLYFCLWLRSALFMCKKGDKIRFWVKDRGSVRVTRVKISVRVFG